MNGHVHAAVDLACAQAKPGHVVSACSGGGDFDTLLSANGVETVIIDQTRRPGAMIKATVSLAYLVRSGAFDVVTPTW